MAFSRFSRVGIVEPTDLWNVQPLIYWPSFAEAHRNVHSRAWRILLYRDILLYEEYTITSIIEEC